MQEGQIKQVTKSIDGDVLFYLDQADIKSGDHIGIIGPNGAGKSTLFKLLLGTDVDYEGMIRLDGFIEHVPQLGAITDESGGEMTKRRISMALRQRPDILLLDEPTTHLDEAGQTWLVNQLKRFRGTVIAISHDRYFLKQFANKIWSFQNGKVKSYSGNFDDYLIMHQQEEENQRLAYKSYQGEKKKLVNNAKKAAQRSNQMKQVNPNKVSYGDRHLIDSHHDVAEKRLGQQSKSLQSRLNRLDKVEKVFEAKSLKLGATTQIKVGRPVLRIQHLDVYQGDTLLIEDVNFDIKTGMRVAITGKNGVGKTTLLRTILAVNQPAGVTHGTNFTISWANQDLGQLVVNQSILENVLQDSREDEQVARDLLGAMGLRRDKVTQLVESLSGGERVRVALVKALLVDADLLVLDEPTNYLDIASIQSLTNYLQQTRQAVLFISHDQQFVKDAATVVYEVNDQHFILVD